MKKKEKGYLLVIILLVIILVLVIALITTYFNKPLEEELLKEILEAEANSKQGVLSTLTGNFNDWCNGYDVNRDGFVSFGDVSLVFTAFKSEIYSEIYDVQKDGFISFGDVSAVFTAFKSGNWGECRGCDYFVDNTAAGCTNGATNYDPDANGGAGACGIGPTYIYKVWTNVETLLPDNENPSLYQKGDTICFREGTYIHTATLYSRSLATNEQEGVIFTKYPQDAGEAIIEMNGETGYGFILKGGYWTIDGLTIKGSGGEPKADGVKGVYYCIYIAQGVAHGAIKNSKIYDCDKDAIKIVGDVDLDPEAGWNIVDVLLENNEIFNFGEDGIDNTGGDDVTIRGNKVHDAIIPGLTFGAQMILAKNNAKNVVIENNIIYNTGSIGSAICLGGSSKCGPNANIPCPYIEGINIIARNNIIYNIGKTAATTNSIISFEECENCQVYNNLIYDSGQASSSYNIVRTTCENSAYKNKDISFRNNIIYNSQGRLAVLDGALNVQASNNLYSNRPSTSNWPTETNSIYNTAPSLTSDFHYKSGSAGINKGISLSGLPEPFGFNTDKDGFLRPKPSDYPWDIGPYEYNPCGNGAIEFLGTYEEDCDCGEDWICAIIELDGRNCRSFGFSGGDLSCYSPNTPNECKYDTRRCR